MILSIVAWRTATVLRRRYARVFFPSCSVRAAPPRHHVPQATCTASPATALPASYKYALVAHVLHAIATVTHEYFSRY